jgi:hypothetical protein
LDRLETDLKAAAANREQVPWIVAMSHFPLYCSNCPAPGSDPGAYWNSEKCEFFGHDPSCRLDDDDIESVNHTSMNLKRGRDDMRSDGANRYAKSTSKAPSPPILPKEMVPDFEPLFMKCVIYQPPTQPGVALICTVHSLPNERHFHEPSCRKP